MYNVPDIPDTNVMYQLPMYLISHILVACICKRNKQYLVPLTWPCLLYTQGTFVQHINTFCGLVLHITLSNNYILDIQYVCFIKLTFVLCFYCAMIVVQNIRTLYLRTYFCTQCAYYVRMYLHSYLLQLLCMCTYLCTYVAKDIYISNIGQRQITSAQQLCIHLLLTFCAVTILQYVCVHLATHLA